jgi:hypothetical protein
MSDSDSLSSQNAALREQVELLQRRLAILEVRMLSSLPSFPHHPFFHAVPKKIKIVVM